MRIQGVAGCLQHDTDLMPNQQIIPYIGRTRASKMKQKARSKVTYFYIATMDPSFAALDRCVANVQATNWHKHSNWGQTYHPPTILGCVANFAECLHSLICGQTYAASSAKVWKALAPVAGI